MRSQEEKEIRGFSAYPSDVGGCCHCGRRTGKVQVLNYGKWNQTQVRFCASCTQEVIRVLKKRLP